MAGETVSATALIDAPAAAVFAVLADPAKHAAIDGTGRVRAAVDSRPLSAAGQTFRVAMYHEKHPDGDYPMVNRVLAFDPPRAISWEPGQEAGDGSLSFPGWVWRYDLESIGAARTRVTLSYDWSAVSEAVRGTFAAAGAGFPPFPATHLANSLTHLTRLTAGEDSPSGGG